MLIERCKNIFWVILFCAVKLNSLLVVNHSVAGNLLRTMILDLPHERKLIPARLDRITSCQWSME